MADNPELRRVMRENMDRLVRHHLETLRAEVSGKMTGWGLHADDLLKAVTEHVDLAEIDIVDEAAWQGHVTRLRDMQNRRRVREAQKDAEYRSAFSSFSASALGTKRRVTKADRDAQKKL